MKELGIPVPHHDGGWFAMFAPGGTPPRHPSDKLWREVRHRDAGCAGADRLQKLGAGAVADSPADFRKFIQAEVESLREQAKLRVITPE